MPRTTSQPKYRRLSEKAREQLLTRFVRDIDGLYAEVWRLMQGATREEQPQVALVSQVLKLLLPEQREVVTPFEGPTGPSVVIQIAGGVNRGTVTAREQALQLRGPKPAETVVTLDATQE